MAKKPETNFRHRVTEFLKTLKNSWFEPVQQMAIRGSPDFFGICRGRPVGLELKTDQGRVDPLQAQTLNRIRQAGGLAIVARPANWDAVKSLLTKLDHGDYHDQNEEQCHFEPSVHDDSSEAGP